MKMEVLTRNQFQAVQYDLVGSTKVTDWAKPLTPPSSAMIHPNHTSSSPVATATVDQAATKQRHHHHHIHHYNNHQQHYQYQRHHHHQQQVDSPTTAVEADDVVDIPISRTDDSTAVAQLAQRLQSELRAAKSRHLACTEVLLPSDLLTRVAADMIDMSEKEPCGIRGCSVYIEFEDEPGNSRRIASLEVGVNTVSTFELYLTLRHDQTGWTAKLPQFLKNLARRSTIIISPDYTLTKNKLYNTFFE